MSARGDGGHLGEQRSGALDQSIGKNVAVGNLSLIEPTRHIGRDFEELTIDGVVMEF